MQAYNNYYNQQYDRNRQIATVYNNRNYNYQNGLFNQLNTFNASNLPPNDIYEDIEVRRRLNFLRFRAYQARKFKERYPVKWVIPLSILISLISIAAIVIQIIMIAKKSAYYYVGSGIWVGSWFLIASVLAFLLIIKRSYCLYQLMIFMHGFGILVTVGGLIVVNAISSICISANTSCSSAFGGYNIVMIVFGGLLFILTLTFIIQVPKKIWSF